MALGPIQKKRSKVCEELEIVCYTLIHPSPPQQFLWGIPFYRTEPIFFYLEMKGGNHFCDLWNFIVHKTSESTKHTLFPAGPHCLTIVGGVTQGKKHKVSIGVLRPIVTYHLSLFTHVGNTMPRWNSARIRPYGSPSCNEAQGNIDLPAAYWMAQIHSLNNMPERCCSGPCPVTSWVGNWTAQIVFRGFWRSVLDFSLPLFLFIL